MVHYPLILREPLACAEAKVENCEQEKYLGPPAVSQTVGAGHFCADFLRL